MENSSSSVDVIYYKKVPLIIKQTTILNSNSNKIVNIDDQEKRNTGIYFQLSYSERNNGRIKVLNIQITDPEDPFFLYTLEIGEDDFHVLKNEQNLLVDFQQFPISFTQLLDECINSKFDDNPKFVAKLINDSTRNSILQIIETNSFKHITHLSLSFIPGNDTSIKKYLSDLVKETKIENKNLKSKLEKSVTQLTNQLKSSENRISELTSELENLKLNNSETVSKLKVQYSEDLLRIKEQMLKEREELRVSLEKDKSQMEDKYNDMLNSLNQKHSSLNSTYSHVLAHSQSLETQLNNLQKQNDKVTHDYSISKKDIETLNNNIKILERKLLEKEKDYEKLLDQLTNKSEKISEKDNKLKNNEKFLEELTRKNEKLEEELEYHINQSKQWKESFNRTRNEINKGNQIIRHLQNELRSTKSKSKIKDEVTIKQEKLLDERHNTIKEQEKRIEEIKTQLKEKTEKIQTLTVQNEKINKELSESKERLEESTNVINYLQKQLNEDALNRPIGVSSFKTNKYSTFDFDKYSSPVAQTDFKLRSHTSFINKDNIPQATSTTTKNSIKSSSLYRSSNINNMGFNSSNLMYTKPLLSPNKENITKILNPKLKSNIQRNILDNSNYDNIKNHLPTSSVELGSKSTFNTISSQNKENIDNSTIPSKITTNIPIDFNRISISTTIPTSHNVNQTKSTSIPLKSNYF
eukprot:jgi/Orpsp1_1/1187363/evm.model.d7180000057184.1